MFKSPIIRTFLILFSFLSLSVLYFGYGSFHHFNQLLIGDTATTDKYFYVWSLAWWPYAILHHLNPFITYSVWSPVGFNLTKTTAIPGLALLALPITLTAGPIAAHNLLAILTPGLAAWTCFLLCNFICQKINNASQKAAQWEWHHIIPALIAGFFFGFSSYEISHMLGHLNLTAGIFLLPLLVYLFLRATSHELTQLWFIISATASLILLFLISSELLVVFTLLSALAYSLAYYFMQDQRSALIKMIPILCFIYGITTVFVSPYLYFFMTHHQQGDVLVYHFYTDLLNLINPTPVFWLHNAYTTQWATAITPNFLEQNSYLGIPVILIWVIFSIQYRKYAYAKVLISLAIITLLLSFGPHLQIAGQRTLTFPWHHLFHLPIIKYIQFNRLGLLLSFYTALMIAIWLQQEGANKLYRYGLALFAFLFMIPSFDLSLRQGLTTSTPNFFSHGDYKKYISANDNVMILPFGQYFPSIVWQAQAHFYFRMPNNAIYVRQPPGFDGPIDLKFRRNLANQIDLHELKQYLQDKQVNAIVVTDAVLPKWRHLLSHLPAQSQKIDDVELYRIYFSKT